MARSKTAVRAISTTALATAMVFGVLSPALATPHTATGPLRIIDDSSIEEPIDEETPAEETSAEEPSDAESHETESPDEELVLEDEVEGNETDLQLSPRAFSLAPMSASTPSQGLWGDKKNRRIGGADRYETAALISKDTYPTASAVNSVVVATGADFPDALSAAPLAAKLKGPLLMTQPNTLSAATRTEIQRLKPHTIIVIGGTGAVTKKVESDLRKLLPGGGSLKRIGGVDRYETSVKIAQAGWTANTQSDVFFATGTDFPDALSAGAAAGAIGAPVILVPGMNNKVGPQTHSYIKTKKTTTIHIVGGTGVVSDGIQKDARSIGSVKAVKRYQGADRFATTAAVAKQVFTKATNTYIANAFDFPDALAGAAAAGAKGAPLLLTGNACIPSVIYDANDRLVPGDTVLLGGTGVLKATVQHGNECMKRPSGASNASFTGMQQLYAKINKARYDQGRSAFRVADTKVGTPAYAWAASKKFSRNGSLKAQQPWVKNEAIARASVATGSQVNYVYNMFITDTKHGTRQAILQTYGGVRPYVSVGYLSASTGYATLHIGTTPK